jgi:hypothetical protein
MQVRLHGFVVGVEQQPVADERPQQRRQQREHDRRTLHDEHLRPPPQQVANGAAAEAQIAAQPAVARHVLDEREPELRGELARAAMLDPREEVDVRRRHGPCARATTPAA